MEKDRIISEYQSREQRGDAGLYSILRQANQLTVHSLERALLRTLAAAGISDLASLRFLDVGCGTGGQLLRWMQWGARPEHCAGIDLMPHRLEVARQCLPASVLLSVGDASQLPFAANSFDITSQFTVFSSILDDTMQQAVASEMLRVTKPGGILLSYDFWLNPKNPATRGVRLGHLRRLFPGCEMYVQRITLAPPICRRLAPFSPVACRLLEAMRIFNSHYLAMIQRRTPGSR